VGAGSVSIAAGQFTDAALNPGGADSDSIAIDTVSDPNDFDWLGSPGNDIVGNPDAHQPQTIYGGSGDDAIYGGTGGDTIFGGSGTDSLYGNNSGDVLYGGSGNDFLWGGNGSDRLIGGYGADTLTDGLGNDIFVYLFINDSRPGEADTITHFNSNIDTIDLSAIDANVNVAGIQHFTAVTQTTDVQVNNINWYLVGGETIIQADVNGDAIADFEIYLAENIALQTTDFILS
jgi:Ca2+-binding RTX toxin-like protein